MYTSVLDEKRVQVLRHAKWNLGFALFCGFFAAVYEHFSFGVYSDSMLFSFAAPLAAGLLLVCMASGKRAPGGTALQLLDCTALTFAVGGIASGVVEIYGTENRLLRVYPAAGGVLLLLTVLAFLLGRRKQA